MFSVSEDGAGEGAGTPVGEELYVWVAMAAAGAGYATLKPFGYCCAYASLESRVGTLMGKMGTGPLDSEGVKGKGRGKRAIQPLHTHIVATAAVITYHLEMLCRGRPSNRWIQTTIYEKESLKGI